jgi:hypothetical protein
LLLLAVRSVLYFIRFSGSRTFFAFFFSPLLTIRKVIAVCARLPALTSEGVSRSFRPCFFRSRRESPRFTPNPSECQGEKIDLNNNIAISLFSKGKADATPVLSCDASHTVRPPCPRHTPLPRLWPSARADRRGRRQHRLRERWSPASY